VGAESRMSIEVETKDCTGLSDVELEEMAELSAECSFPLDMGTLTKESEAWVLVTHARDNGKLKGFALSTLERIGGTPCVLIGLAAIKQNAKRDTVLRALMTEGLHRAVLAFPDEDVLVATRMTSASAFEAYRSLTEVVPRKGHKASGEERAWGRRLAKRFGVVPSRYDDRRFRVTGEGSPPIAFDHDSAKPSNVADFAEFFEGVDPESGECVIAFGWAMAEDLDKLA
jgi:hypothetical protein